MAALSDVRDAIATALSQIGGLNAWGKLPPQVHVPCAVVEFDRVAYHVDMGVADVLWFFNLTVLVGMNDTVASQDALDAYLEPSGASSVREALETDPTLGGVVSDLILRQAGGYQGYDVSGETYWGVRFQLEVR